jgi:transposase
MMGHQSDSQDKLFYSFNLEDHVPQNHLLRGINQFLDLSDLRQHLSQLYSHTGRPSIDPELMIRMLIIGYSFGIRSERRLYEEVHLNLAYRWFCRLGLQDSMPDHSSFSKNRHGRFRDGEVFRKLFETVLQRCMKEGLVGGEGFATDASVIKADVKRQHAVAGSQKVHWGNPEAAPRPVREYLEALAETHQPATPPKSISLTDPASSWTAAHGPAYFAYCTNYLIDLDAGIIMDVEASSVSKSAEVNATKTMIDRVEAQYDIKPKRLVGDTNYGSAPMLEWMVNAKDIEPHVPVWEKSKRIDGTLSRSDFAWNEAANEYRCPEGHPLKSNWRPFKNPRLHITKADTIVYRASQKHCTNCPIKEKCCPDTPRRKVVRSLFEPARDVARNIAKTDAYLQSRKDRKKVEMLFAHLKRILKLDRLRLRGFSGAQDEFLLAATAQNLRRMAMWLAPIAQNAKAIPA